MNSHRPCRLFRPFNRRTLRLYLTVLAAGLTLLGAGAIINLASLKLTNTGIEVRGDNNQISFEVPRSPGEVTAATIACDGTVEVVRRESATVGYRATQTFGDDSGATFYSLVLTLDEAGRPRQQFSIYIEQDTDDRTEDGRDGKIDGRYSHTEFLPVDSKSLECLLAVDG